MSRWGNCSKCGGENDMYYTPWCPRCDKPEPQITKTLNLIKSLRYLEANGYPGIKDRLWSYFLDDIVDGGGNDSIIKLNFDIDEYRLKGYDEEDREKIKMFLKAFRDTFETDIQFEVSW